MPEYTMPGLAPFVITDAEDDYASELAIDTLVELGGTCEEHGELVQTAVQLGIIAQMRSMLTVPPATPLLATSPYVPAAGPHTATPNDTAADIVARTVSP
jgi:hypothetical protein